MDRVTDSLSFMRYVPLCLALLFWCYYMYIRWSYKKYDSMKRHKKWHDLTIHSVNESKEEILNQIINAKKRQIRLGFPYLIIFSLIGIFWFFYIH